MFNHGYATLLIIFHQTFAHRGPIPTETSLRQAPPTGNELVRETGGPAVTLQQRVLGFLFPPMSTVVFPARNQPSPGEPETCRALIGQPWPRPSLGPGGGVSTREPEPRARGSQNIWAMREEGGSERVVVRNSEGLPLAVLEALGSLQFPKAFTLRLFIQSWDVFRLSVLRVFKFQK